MGEGDFIAGGYFLTRKVTRDDAFMAADLLPTRFCSLSDCLTDMALDLWWNDDNIAAAGSFGVAASRFDELIEWYTERFGVSLGAPNVAYSRDVIAEFVHRFEPDPTDLVVLGCALAPDHREQILSLPGPGEGMGAYGVATMLERGQQLEPGGHVLGFEPMGYQYGLEHSWLCNGLERVVADAVGVRPDSQTGLLGTFDDAIRATTTIDRDDVGAEPGLWLPWMVIEYEL